MKCHFSKWGGLINEDLLLKTLSKIPINDKLCPKVEDVFKAFQLCSSKDCKVVMLGQDPYPQKGVATGILFGNKITTPKELLSPSLKIIKEAAIDYTITHNYPIEFDNSLEEWGKQGVLMLNSSLTVEQNRVGSHTMIWRPFISDFLKRLSIYDNRIIFVLFGEIAGTLSPYILSKNILVEKHPSFYARTNSRMSSDIFYSINRLVKEHYGEKIIWYKDYNIEEVDE